MSGRVQQIARGLALLVLLPAGDAWAQRPAPFETLDLLAGATVDVNQGLLFYDLWRPGKGAAAGVATPFYFGTAEAGGAVHRYGARADSVPAFDALVVYAGWGLGAEVGRLGVHGGVRAGLHRMTFDEDTFVGVRNESELALGAVARVHVDVARGWALYGEAAYMKTYTYIRLQQVWITAGIRARITTPSWLRRVLR